MTYREMVLEQIHHRETRPVPCTLSFEPDVEDRLDQHYGDGSWRDRLEPYIVRCGGIDRRKSEAVSETLNRDLFGTTWRTDQRPFQLEEPGMAMTGDGALPFSPLLQDPLGGDQGLP